MHYYCPEASELFQMYCQLLLYRAMSEERDLPVSKGILTERQPGSMMKTEDNTEEESEASKLLRHINFQMMGACTINFNF